MFKNRRIPIIKTALKMLLKGKFSLIYKNRDRIMKGLPMWLHTVSKDKITILATKHTLFIAHGLQYELEFLGIPTSIVTSLGDNDHGQLFIVIAPQIHPILPWNYVVYQVEQISASNWSDNRYIKILQRSLGVLDYSNLNIRTLQRHNIPLEKLHFLPIAPIQDYEMLLLENHSHQMAPQSKDIDVLFYGAPHSQRRQKYLSALKKHFNVTVASEVFGEPMVNLIRRAKLVVNIHYYEDALLETTRIFEALSLGTSVISERSYDYNEHASLNDLILFTPQGNIDAMLQAITNHLEHYTDDSKVTHPLTHKLTQQRSFFMKRFLLHLGFLPFSAFALLAEEEVAQLYEGIDSPKVCLSLPETVDRRKSFLQESKSEYKIFDGLRYSPPWVGCGMSYKFLFHVAKKMNCKMLTICEDDVSFPSDFTERLQAIYQYLTENKDKWDIFAGMIADYNPNTHISEINSTGGMEYVYIDKMVSMVFNIYNSTIFDKFLEWDERNMNVNHNTIDRFIENSSSLRIVTCHPFLVEHKENLNSSLWNGQSNICYTRMVVESEARLLEDIERHKVARGICDNTDR